MDVNLRTFGRKSVFELSSAILNGMDRSCDVDANAVTTELTACDKTKCLDGHKMTWKRGLERPWARLTTVNYFRLPEKDSMD